MSEWDNINDVAGWTDKLSELLAAARAAAQKDELAPRLAVNERLMAFVENSWPHTTEIKALDDIATKTASALLDQTIEERLKAITERTGEYQKLSKSLNALAEATAAQADSVRLKAITSFIDSATNLVDTAKELQKTLKDTSSDAKLSEKILAALTTIQELRSAVGKRI